MGFIFVLRAIYNLFTWRDPYLCFWISFLGPFVVMLLHFFPWRIVMGVAGILVVGPQNWVLRILREKEKIQPPDPDSQLMFANRFYDWPPEPHFARVKVDSRVIDPDKHPKKSTLVQESAQVGDMLEESTSSIGYLDSSSVGLFNSHYSKDDTVTKEGKEDEATDVNEGWHESINAIRQNREKIS